MSGIEQNIKDIRSRIQKAAEKSGKSGEEIKLVVVTKTVEAERVNEAIRYGIEIIGENRVQEAEEKFKQITERVEKHLVGHLQTNKAKKAVELFDFIQSVDSARIAEEIDREAKRFGVTVLGTGVNPGFVMDALPVFLSTICKNVEKVEVTRIVNASLRREPLQRKIGAGITVEEFQHKVEEKKLGHVGLLESLVMIADTLGWDLVINETIEPIVAKNSLKTEYFEVEPGKVAGIFQTVTGAKNGEIRLKLVLRMEIDAKEQFDRTQIFGEPDVDMKIQNGVFGDDATVAIVVNLIDAVVDAPPGFLTMKGLPFLPHLT